MTQPTQYRVTVIGCGKMGSALIHGWLNANLLKSAEIIDPNSVPGSITAQNIVFHVKHVAVSRFAANGSDTDMVILCIKPQIMDEICAELTPYLRGSVPVLSIAAGKDIAYFEKHLPPSTPLIRTMPNLPATVGKGMTALYANDHASKAHREMAEALMKAAGETLWLEDEALMDAVTALSGSGPAYVFHLIEALAIAGQKIGLPSDHATILARQTIIGAAALVEASPDIPASTLRENVTSKGGTTEAALEILMKGDFQDILNKALTAARDRGRDLAN